MSNFALKVPIKKSGEFDVKAQKEIAERFTAEHDKRALLDSAKKVLDAMFDRYMN
jgi:hypothetical protein